MSLQFTSKSIEEVTVTMVGACIPSSFVFAVLVISTILRLANSSVRDACTS